MISTAAWEAIVTKEAPAGMDLVSAFANTGEAFSAARALAAYASEHDLALGSMQRDAPMGVMRDRDGHSISKWRNMTKKEQGSLDGRVVWSGGGPREGIAKLYMRPVGAPEGKSTTKGEDQCSTTRSDTTRT